MWLDDTFPFDFSLVEFLFPTGLNREAALKAYRGPGAGCLHRRFPARGSISPGVQHRPEYECVRVFGMDTPVSANLTSVVALSFSRCVCFA